MDMSTLYLVKEGDRSVILAAERDGRLYGYVPNVNAFVYNKPMSVDFLIDRNMTYQPVDTDEAAAIIKAGQIGKINGRTNKFLLDRTKAETRRIDPIETWAPTSSTNRRPREPASPKPRPTCCVRPPPAGGSPTRTTTPRPPGSKQHANWPATYAKDEYAPSKTSP